MVDRPALNEEEENTLMIEVSTEAPHLASAWCHRAGWYRAATLAERAASLQGAAPQADRGNWASEKAERFLQQWKTQTPFQTGTTFADRLAMDEITERDLFQLLAEPLEALQARLPMPEWVEKLSQAIEEPAFSTDVPLPEPDEHTSFAFLPALQPLLAHAQNRLRLGLEDLARHSPRQPFDAQPVMTSLVASLSRVLLSKASRTLALELKVAGMLGQLSGQTPQERFQHFLQRFSQQEALWPLFEEYSVLARQLVLTCDHWVASSLEVLRRLCADWDEIRATLTPESDPGLLVEIQSGVGDLHREGRSVMLLKFRSGFRLVYKPKSLAIDIHFQELLQWLNEHSTEPKFHMLKVINKGDYGWAEFVEERECTSEEEVQRFYERQGAYLALLYILDATDFHYENLIAAGEHPILIDLETLFHPRITGPHVLFSGTPAHEALTNSVYMIGLLPQRLWGNEEAEGVIINGLGGSEGQLTPRAVPRWEDAGTDQMRLIRTRVELPPARNLPRRNGKQVEALDYRETLLAGFKRMYHLLLTHRNALAADLLPRFAQDDIRFVARPTDIYARFLYNSFSPEMLRDALERERHFDRLWVGIQWQPYMSRLIPAERADLLRGDVPFFTTRPDSRDLFTSQGTVISAFFQESSFSLVSKRLERLGAQDLERQLWIINASFDGAALDARNLPKKPLALQPSRPNATCKRLLTAAQAIGERLGKDALREGNAVGWLSLSEIREQEWALLPAGLDLYSGLPGITLFLAYLERLTGNQHALDLAQAALRSIHALLDHANNQQAFSNIGAFEGWGGMLYLYSHLGKLWNDPALLQRAENIVGRLPSLIEQDKEFDMVSGSAGCIAALLSLHTVAPSPRTLEMAIQAGDHLINKAQPMHAGIGWKISYQETPLTGFAHGNAGIVLSLLRLAAASGEDRFRQAARAALAYERSLYVPEQQNWPDLRKERASARSLQATEPEAQRFMVAWCHGAAGIGLARLASTPYLDDDLLHDEIEAALSVTQAHGFWGRNNICHGDFGNLETLLVASQTGDWPNLSKRVKQITGALLDTLKTTDQQEGPVSDMLSSGLMTGRAGIGFQLLRLTEPKHMPSVLLLEPPPA
jgi:type 2 lantibiotic biosynthesis protein LanM